MPEQLTFADYCIRKYREIAKEVLVDRIKEGFEALKDRAFEAGSFKKAWWAWFLMMRDEKDIVSLRMSMRHVSYDNLEKDFFRDWEPRKD